jgi:hypothetical protein
MLKTKLSNFLPKIFSQVKMKTKKVIVKAALTLKIQIKSRMMKYYRRLIHLTMTTKPNIQLFQAIIRLY